MILLGISMFLLAAGSITNLRRRISEFALLRMNGVPASVVAAMIFLEYLPGLLITVLCLCIESILLYFAGLRTVTGYVWLSFVYILLMLVLLGLVNMIWMKWLDIEKILRDE